MKTGTGENKAIPRFRISVFRKAIYAVTVTVVFFVVLELLLVAFGISPLIDTEDPYVGFDSRIPLFVRQAGGTDVPIMATAENRRAFFNYQQFSAAKGSGTYRVFCVGGSVTYGRPYNDATSFCGWLRAILPAVEPSVNWEVINAGGISYASYRVALLMQELVRYEPDLFIVFCGHNEFLEDRTYGDIAATPEFLRRAGAVMARSRCYSVIRSVVHAAGGYSSKKQTLPAEVEAILDRSVGPESYRRDDVLGDRIIEHYRSNLLRMIDIARRHGADLLLVNPASNLRDCSPFKSLPAEGLPEDRMAMIDAAVEASRRLAAEGRLAEALERIEGAVTLDPRQAELHYLRGRILWDLGRYEKSREAFIRARDEDICPLRAVSELQKVMDEVALSRSVQEVDFVSLAAAMSEHAIPGSDVFLDHVHPVIEANRKLALAIMEKMAAMNLVRPPEAWDSSEVEAVTRQVEAGLDNHSHGVALRNLSKVMAWAGKFEQAGHLARQALVVLPDDAETLNNLGVMLYRDDRFEEAIDYFRKAVAAEPSYAEAHYNLGRCLQRQDVPAEAAGAYRSAVELQDSYTDAWFNLGTVLQSTGDRDGAASSYLKVLELDPGNIDAMNNLGNIYLAGKIFDKAEKYYRRLLKHNPSYAKGHYNLGLALYAQGRPGEAADQFREALRLNPDYAPPKKALKEIEGSHLNYSN